LAASACGRSDASPKSQGGGARAGAKGAKTEDSAGGSVDLGSAGYKPGTVAAVGSVSGTITLDGPPRSDVVALPANQPVCGKSAPGPVTATAKGLSNAIVWIADMKTGKELPLERRIDLSSED